MPPATLPGPFAMLTTSSHLPRRCLAYRTLQLWSLCALWSSICIAVHKPRAFHYCGLSVEPEAPEALVIHSAGWIPHTALIRTHGLFKSLGVEYPINPSDSTSLRTMKLKLLVSIKALSVKKATPRSINLVMAKCLYARGAYVGILSSWSLRECDEIDSIFASELRRRSKNLRTSQTENLYQPVREGGLGFQRFSSMVQQRKRNCIHRLLTHGDVWTKLAVQGLCTSGHPSPSHSSLAALTPQSIRPGYWTSSLLSYGFQGNAGPTKPLRSKPSPAPPELYDSLTGTISTSMRCNKAQHAYLRDRHLLTYVDVVAWTGTSWRWQLPELPPDLSEGIRRLTLPVGASVPLLPGQAWHMADSTQLFSNRLTEILTVSTYSTPQGFRSDIVYRHWQLPHPVLSPPLRTVVTKTSSPQLYHGPTDMLQHRQLHRIFWTILCTAIYTILCCAYPSTTLCVSLDCSVDGVSPPSGAIRNRRPIL